MEEPGNLPDGVSYVLDHFTDQDRARSMLERGWKINMGFYRGFHWHEWDYDRWNLSPSTAKQPRGTIREVRNHCRTVVKRSVAALSNFTPRFKGRPATRDTEDEQAARCASHVAQSYWDRGAELLKYQAATIASIYGTVVLKAGWDANAGKEMEVPIGFDEMGEIVTETYREGDFRTEVLTPDTIYVDPMAEHEDEARWFCQVSEVSLDWVHENYPDSVEEVDDFIDEERRAKTTRRVHEGLGHLGLSRVSSDGSRYVTRYEFYERPTLNHPRGRFIVLAGRVLLRDGPNPCKDHGSPFLFYRKIEVPGSFWGDTELTDAITINRNYNRMMSRVIEHCLKFGSKMPLIWPFGNEPQQQFVSGVGEVVRTFGGSTMPQYLPIPNLPGDIKEEMQRCLFDLDEITGTTAVDKGNYPGKASGIAIDILTEQTAKLREGDQRRFGMLWEEWARRLLYDLQRYASEERMVQLRGRHDSWDIVSFRGADLEGTDVVIEVDSMIPKSRRLALNEVQIMLQAGLMNAADPGHRALAYKMIELEDPSAFNFDKDQHRRVAQIEEQLARSGQMIPPHQVWHDGDSHITQHFDTLNSDDFRTWDPQAQQVLLAHVQDTLMRLMPQAGVTLPPDQQAALSQPQKQEVA